MNTFRCGAASKDCTSPIEWRKREFVRRENENSELIVNGFGSFIGLSQNCVTVRQEGETVLKQPIDTLSHITISGKGITMSSNLIEYCLEKKISIDFFGHGFRHCGSIMSNRIIEGAHWSRQGNCTDDRRAILARSIIMGKVKNQFHLIKYFHKYHKKEHPELIEIFNEMECFYGNFDKALKSETALDAESYIPFLMSLEARAAGKYWKYLRHLLSNEDIRFEGREKKGATDVVNCMLNYGYAILYSRVWQALLKAKLNPFDSVIHVPQSGKPTFVYDVVEIFRAQAVDRVVVSLVQKGYHLSVCDGMLDESTKVLVAKSILERLNRIEKFNGMRMTLDEIILHQAREIAFFFREEESSFKPYVAKW